MDAVLNFIDQRTTEQQQLLHGVRYIILNSSLQIEEGIKWKIPFYSFKGLLCYLNPSADGIALGFCRGALLSNEQGLLQGKGKEVRLLYLTEPDAIPQAEIRALIQEAILLNQTMLGRKNYYV